MTNGFERERMEKGGVGEMLGDEALFGRAEGVCGQI
jgi:hypothetical protein